MTDIELILKGTPTFLIKDTATHWQRLGAIYSKTKQGWTLPAMPPFLNNILQDLETVYNIKLEQLSPEIQAHIQACGNLEDWTTKVKQYPWPVECKAHQYDGIAEILYNYRWLLNWDMGTGKTKIAIDAVSYLGEKTLVLCPPIAIANWQSEIHKFTNGKSTAILLQNQSPDKKRKLIAEAAQNHQYLIANYDLMRTLGHPHIDSSVYAYCKKNQLSLHTGLLTPLKQISSAKLQLDLVQKWHTGVYKPQQIREIVQETLVKTPYQWVMDFPYSVFICDESHRIKNYRSARTQACKVLATKAARRIFMSGTSIQGSPWDLYAQAKVLAPTIMPEDAEQFRSTFFKLAECRFGKQRSGRPTYIEVGTQNLHILHERMQQISSVRKLDDCVSLPERQFITIEYELSAAQKQSYNQLASYWVMETPDSEYRAPNAAVRLSKLLQICSGFTYLPEHDMLCDTCDNKMPCVLNGTLPGSKTCIKRNEVDKTRTVLRYSDNAKLNTLMELLSDITPNYKVVIWAALTQELDDIAERLTRAEISFVRVDGSNTHQVQKEVRKFEDNPKCKVYLGQISTGIAINLTAAKYSIYYSRDWSDEHREQSLARTYRMGQTQKTVVYDLCGKGTVEAQQMIALKAKRTLSELITNKIECSLCIRYKECLANETQPWDRDCILKTGYARNITEIGVLK